MAAACGAIVAKHGSTSVSSKSGSSDGNSSNTFGCQTTFTDLLLF